MVARPPKGWAGEEPVRPRARILMDLGRSARYWSGDWDDQLRRGLPCYFFSRRTPRARVTQSL